MAVSQVSPNIPVSQAAKTADVQKLDAKAAAAATAEKKASQKAQADKVTISRQATELAANQYSPKEEAKEPPVQKEVESLRGKK